MTVFIGRVFYYATGEGVQEWWYVAKSISHDDFKKEMFINCEIPEYYHSSYQRLLPNDPVVPSWIMLTAHNLEKASIDSFYKSHLKRNMT